MAGTTLAIFVLECFWIVESKENLTLLFGSRRSDDLECISRGVFRKHVLRFSLRFLVSGFRQVETSFSTRFGISSASNPSHFTRWSPRRNCLDLRRPISRALPRRNCLKSRRSSSSWLRRAQARGPKKSKARLRPRSPRTKTRQSPGAATSHDLRNTCLATRLRTCETNPTKLPNSRTPPAGVLTSRNPRTKTRCSSGAATSDALRKASRELCSTDSGKLSNTRSSTTHNFGNFGGVLGSQDAAGKRTRFAWSLSWAISSTSVAEEPQVGAHNLNSIGFIAGSRELLPTTKCTTGVASFPASSLSLSPPTLRWRCSGQPRGADLRACSEVPGLHRRVRGTFHRRQKVPQGCLLSQLLLS